MAIIFIFYSNLRKCIFTVEEHNIFRNLAPRKPRLVCKGRGRIKAAGDGQLNCLVLPPPSLFTLLPGQPPWVYTGGGGGQGPTPFFF